MYKNQGIGFDILYFLTPTTIVNIAAEKYWNDLSSLEKGYVILSRPEYKIFTKLTKKLNNNLFSIKATFFGRQDLEKFYGTTYNIAGVKNGRYSKEYLILDADYTRELNKNHKVFFGIENIFNFVQVNTSPQIAVREDSGNELDNINSWGPVRGRFFYVGFKSSI